MRRGSGKSAAKPWSVNDFTGLRVLRGVRGKSARFPNGLNHLARLLVLHRPEQDSTEVTEEISPRDAERILGEIPRQVRERRWEHQRRDHGLRILGPQTAVLKAMRGEVIGITPTPGGLGLGASSDLTRRRRTGALATTEASVRHKPAAADPAGPLREHPQMLGAAEPNQCGLFLASRPGSILASAEALCKMPKLLDDLFSIDEDDDRLGYNVAKDHEIPATEAWNR